MPGQRLNVVVTRRLPESVETRMKELFDVSLREVDTPMRREELVVALQEADVLVPTVTDQIDASLLAQSGENLRLTANACARRSKSNLRQPIGKASTKWWRGWM